MLNSLAETFALAPTLSSGDQAALVYQRLMQGRDADDPAEFDAHVAASILALAAAEAASDGRSLAETCGLGAAELAALLDDVLLQALIWWPPAGDTPPLRSADEACLLDLLVQCSTAGSPHQLRLAAMLARRAQSPNHLWQDLGLRHRGELGRLMVRHFRPLALRNSSDMKWKKFLYRMICRDAGYTLCTAPSCAECTDFDNCFGDESGESRLARVRRGQDQAAVTRNP
jgi:nitrogen fixation protein NifQ